MARTICDLAATESARDTEHAFQEALYREIVTERPSKPYSSASRADEVRQ